MYKCVLNSLTVDISVTTILGNMYGKAFESMYEGSMVGAGINVFAVWNFIIAKARAGSIEINPKLLAFTLGGSESEVDAALAFLCRPDPLSRSKVEGGCRLVKEGQFLYRLVNWKKYQAIKNEAERREYNRVKQAEYRAKPKSNGFKKSKGSPALKGEVATIRAENNGASPQQVDAIQTESLPKQCHEIEYEPMPSDP